MTITQDIRTRRKHRGKTPWQLVQTIGRLERQADDATCQMVAMATEIDELRAERNELAAELDKAAIDYNDLLNDRDEWREQALALWARFGSQIADEANASKVTVPPAYRDTTDLADQATAPIDVKPLWIALGVGPSTAVTDPGHVPAWAGQGETATQ